MTSPAPETAEQYLARQREEWGQYVAVAPIDHDGARAYNPGDPVPASNVERWKYDEQGLVEKTAAPAKAPAAAKAATSPEKDA